MASFTLNISDQCVHVYHPLADLVLEVEGGLSPGSRLVVNESALAPQEEPSPLKARHAEAADVDVNDELFNGRE